MRVLETIAGAVASNRVPHAYLFFGPEGVGKRAVALSLAAALQCEQPAEGRACGACRACTRVFSMGHPDVRLLMPVPNDTSIEAISERLQRMAENPYATVDFERRPSLDSVGGTSQKQVIYNVDSIRKDLRQQMSLASVEGGFRIVIMTDADRMNAAAANAFLKLLEEPGSRTVFILTTDRSDRLLATVRSRCQLLRFDRLSVSEISEALSERVSIDPSRAETVARMADGSYSRAVDLATSEELFSTRTYVLDFLRAAYSHDGALVVGYVDQLQRMGREPLKFFLQLMLGWLRDLFLYRELGEDASVVNIDQIHEIRRFCTNLPDARLEAMIELVEEATELVERNVNLRLCLVVFAHALGASMRGVRVQGLIRSLSDEPVEA